MTNQAYCYLFIFALTFFIAGLPVILLFNFLLAKVINRPWYLAHSQWMFVSFYSFLFSVEIPPRPTKPYEANSF